ncbi:hypothetical protein FQZ97_963840 [compost metagenome]
MGVALARLLGRDPLVDHRHEHVFVVAAVEDRDVPGGRHLLVDAPEVVVRALWLGGRFPAHGVHAQRAGLAEHAAHGAVLARSVRALQDHQQLVAAVGVEQVLQPVDFLGQRQQHGLVGVFVADGKRFGARVERRQRGAFAVLPVFAIARRLDLPGLPGTALGGSDRCGREGQ